MARNALHEAEQIKSRVNRREISYEQARAEAEALAVDINAKAREIAARYGVRPRLVSAGKLLR